MLLSVCKWQYCLYWHLYSKTYVQRPLSKRPKIVFKTNFCLMQVKSITECSKAAILSTFIKIPVVIDTFILSFIEWPFYTGFTVVWTLSLKNLLLLFFVLKTLITNIICQLCTVKPVLSGHSKRRPKIGFQAWFLLNAGQKCCRMLQESILQYFRPSLSYHLSLRPLFCLFWVVLLDRFYCI